MQFRDTGFRGGGGGVHIPDARELRVAKANFCAEATFPFAMVETGLLGLGSGVRGDRY